MQDKKYRANSILFYRGGPANTFLFAKLSSTYGASSSSGVGGGRKRRAGDHKLRVILSPCPWNRAKAAPAAGEAARSGRTQRADHPTKRFTAETGTAEPSPYSGWRLKGKKKALALASRETLSESFQEFVLRFLRQNNTIADFFSIPYYLGSR